MPRETKRRGRPITGSPKRGADGLWRVRVPIPGTNRTKPITLGPEIQTEERAKEVVRHWHERLLEDPSLLGEERPAAALTNAEYLDRWTEERKGRVRTAGAARADILKHVLDDTKLKSKRCAATTPDDLRRVVVRLNAKAESGQIESSTARRLWAQVRCMFRQTFDHERDDLRIRKDDPTAGVRPPRKGSERAKAVLYPNEARQLLECAKVPLEARRLWTALLYMGTRYSELCALDWASVDLTHRRILVHESVDRDSDEDDATKETKTGSTRDIDILPALYPMLEAMHEESGGRGRLFPSPYEQPARELRVHLMLAGVTRDALHKTDKSRRSIRAQDLRASCATWLGLAEQLPDGGAAIVGRRVSGSYVRDFLGHDRYETTERYYERGQGLRLEHVGIPFQPIPTDLVTRIPAANTCEVPSDGPVLDEESECDGAATSSQTAVFPSNPTSLCSAFAPSGARPGKGRRSSRSIPW
jgi:integrase